MPGSEPLSEADAEVLPVIRRRVVEGAAEWFPELRKPVTVQLHLLSRRPKSLLLLARLGDGDQQVPVLAKVRRETSAYPEPDAERPRLATGRPTLTELTEWEYRGLRSIFAMFGGPRADPAFRAVRPLDHLPAERTILMEYLPARTLRHTLTQASRLNVRRRGTRALGTDPLAEWAWAGAWLRRFHEGVPVEDVPVRQGTRDEVVERFHAYQRFLTERLGAGSFGDLGRQGAGLAAAVLPARLPMAIGHGDFAPRNVFVTDEHKVAVLDPMPRWAVPRYEDLCRFLVGMRLLGAQVHTHGLAFPDHELERRRKRVLDGYYGEDEVPTAQLRCYELLVQLDKWSALVATADRGWRSSLATRSVGLASGFLRRQSQRLLDAADYSR